MYKIAFVEDEKNLSSLVEKYLKSEGFEILPIKQSDEARNYWNGKLFSEEN